MPENQDPFPSSHTHASSLRRRLRTVFTWVVLVVIAVLLYLELKDVSLSEIGQGLTGITHSSLGWALLFLVLSIALFGAYDWLALRYVGLRVPHSHAFLVGVVSFVVSMNAGFALLTGSALRHRLYRGFGMELGKLTRLMVFLAATLGVSWVFVTGLVLAAGVAPIGLADRVPRALVHFSGLGLLGAVAVYFFLCLTQPVLKWRRWQLNFPSFPLATGQLVVGGLDVIFSALVLFFLLDAPGLTFASFLPVYVMGTWLGLLSHFPGGLGVLETAFLYLLPAPEGSAQLLGRLLAYRAIYYLLPLFFALPVWFWLEKQLHGKTTETPSGHAG